MDLVREAGVDVSDWANFAGKNPATNPKYCYEWAFADGSVVVLNLWLGSMKAEGSEIVYRLNLQREIQELASSPRQSAFVGRARRMDEIIRTAYEHAMPVRVIVCDGDRREVSDARSSRVERRMLDPKVWAVTFYDNVNGDCLLTRGATAKRIIDQFALEEQATTDERRRTVARNEYIRSSEVRRRVLNRSGGKCEWCLSPGFLVEDGCTYIETHHIVPLSEGGLDTVSNVVALCPNHHREAHHGQKRAELRVGLTERIRQIC
jgi:5-methylcytosine-specific restriction endonuclease McrA